jgi:hypothetical protein
MVNLLLIGLFTNVVIHLLVVYLIFFLFFLCKGRYLMISG